VAGAVFSVEVDFPEHPTKKAAMRIIYKRFFIIIGFDGQR
jgi:hypothetical protein